MKIVVTHINPDFDAIASAYAVYKLYNCNHIAVCSNMENNVYTFIKESSFPLNIIQYNDKMINDILSFNLPTIFLGDIGQLPPVIGQNSLLKDVNNIDAQLTKVLRQDDTSGILGLATQSRNGERLKEGTYKNCRVLHLKDIDDITKYDIISNSFC